MTTPAERGAGQQCDRCQGVDGAHEKNCAVHRRELRKERQRRQGRDSYTVHPDILGEGASFLGEKDTFRLIKKNRD